MFVRAGVHFTCHFKVTPPLVKSHIPAEFFVRVFVLGWYTYSETAQVLFSLYFVVVKIAHLKSPQQLFTKLAKCHISAEFFVRVFVLG